MSRRPTSVPFLVTSLLAASTGFAQIGPPAAPLAELGDPPRPTPQGLPFPNRVTRLYGVGTSNGLLHVVFAP